MRCFDGVYLPFVDESEVLEVLGDVRHLALARELVWSELKSTPDSFSLWEASSAESVVEQGRNADSCREFFAEMRQRCPRSNLGVCSPLFGPVSVPGSSVGSSLLSSVTVSGPLFCRGSKASYSGQTNKTARETEQENFSASEENRLVQCSSPVSQVNFVTETPAWTPEQFDSQSAVDGVFFEALLSQQLNLSLWMSCANPNETLQEMLRDVQRVERGVCEAKSLLGCINAARLTEQRVFKRRRAEVESQTLKSKVKVVSLQKLLKIGVTNISSAAASSEERLRLWLQE